MPSLSFLAIITLRASAMLAVQGYRTQKRVDITASMALHTKSTACENIMENATPTHTGRSCKCPVGQQVEGWGTECEKHKGRRYFPNTLKKSEGCFCGVVKFNNTKCPAYWELQAPHVATDFRDEDVTGYFYELAFHDYTQYPLCPSTPRCITAVKDVATHADGTKFVNDTWNLACFDKYYPQELLFNLTDIPGYMRGYVPKSKVPGLPETIIAGVVFPNSVVDFKSGPEGWVIEMQCVEALGGVKFVGINFYSKVKTQAAFQEMYLAAQAQGLGFWMHNKPFGLSIVDHTNCTYDYSQSWW